MARPTAFPFRQGKTGPGLRKILLQHPKSCLYQYVKSFSRRQPAAEFSRAKTTPAADWQRNFAACLGSCFI
jgi:hypothetical protein